MVDDKSNKCTEVCEKVYALPQDQKFDVLAILFEYWDEGLIHEGNYRSADEALEHNKEVFFPERVDVENCKTIAFKFSTLARFLRDEDDDHIITSQFPDVIQAHITQSAEMEDVFKGFFNLSFKDKLDFVAEMICRVGCDFLDGTEQVKPEDFEIEGYRIAGHIEDYKNTLHNHFPVEKIKDDVMF